MDEVDDDDDDDDDDENDAKAPITRYITFLILT